MKWAIMSSQQIEFAIRESIIEEKIHEILNWFKRKWCSNYNCLKSSDGGKHGSPSDLSVVQNQNAFLKIKHTTNM